MRRFMAASSLLRRYVSSCGFNSLCKRSLCSVSNSPLISDREDVLVEGNAASRTAILNRPDALNALNLPIGARLLELYRSWEEDPDIGFVALKGRGRAFCAGGDIVSLYNFIRAGNLEECKEFFWTLYNFIYILGTYLKPHVALLHGITMGGGAGISIPGTFRVATDKTVFATPETLIGFHPDAGASFYLSHLPGYLGEYLALTGDKLNGKEMVSCGLATHYSHTAKLPLIEEQLGKLMTDDPSVIETSLENFWGLVQPDQTSVINQIATLNRCFSHDTVEEIVDALGCSCYTLDPSMSPLICPYRILNEMHLTFTSSEDLDTLLTMDGVKSVHLFFILQSLFRTTGQVEFPEESEAGRTQDAWCLSTLKRLKETAPLSLKVSLRSIREGRSQTLDQCLIREYRMSIQALSGQISTDFCEGIRARLVDKDLMPKWNPPSLEQVTKDMIDQYFTPITALEPDLELPTKLREAFT